MLLRLLNPIVWSPRRAPGKFFDFALAEQASVVDMLEAARLTKCTKRAALYLRHAGDEARHASLFTEHSNTLRLEQGKPSLGHPIADTESLFAAHGEEFFLAFVHVGETSALSQFPAYIAYFAKTGAKRGQVLLEGIHADEEHHARYTLRLLIELCGQKAADKLVRRAKRWRAWRAWRRAGNAIASRVHLVVMLLLYALTTPLALAIRVFQPAVRGWRQLK